MKTIAFPGAFLLGAAVVVLVFLRGQGPGQAEANEPEKATPLASRPVDFVKDIQSIFQSRCLSCHGPEKKKAGFRLDSKDMAGKGGESGPAFIPGKSADSLLIRRVLSEDKSERMPPKGVRLSAEQIDVLRTWIDQGAQWPEGVVLTDKNKADLSWWSLQPLAKGEPPAPEGIPAAWAKNPIDRFVFEKLREKGLAPAPPAAKRTLIRRATYDLLGLAPTPEEVETFVRDERPEAYEKLVERLLASPHYGERWGRHWLDVVRFGESTGYEKNWVLDNAWPFRDYVIRSFNDDKPFNQFIQEHLAGDVIGKDNPDVEVGTAFLVSGPYDNVDNEDPVQKLQIRANTIDDVVTAAGTAFLGLTVNCARCHDHKFDPLPQEDYYRLYAAFAGVFHGERVLAAPAERQRHEQQLKPLVARKEQLQKDQAALENAVFQRADQDATRPKRVYQLPPIDPHLTEDRFPPAQARQVRLTILASDRDPKSPDGARIDEFEAWTADHSSRNAALAVNGATAEAPSTMPGDFADAYSPKLAIDGKFGATWIAQGEARLTITFARDEMIDRVVFSNDRLRAFSGQTKHMRFVGEYRIEVSLDGKTWTKVADSDERPPIDERFRRKRLIRENITTADRQRLEALTGELADVAKKINAVPPLRSVWAGTFTQPTEAAYLMKGGDPTQKGALIAPVSLSVLDRGTRRFELALDAPEGERRLALAKWLVQEDNPLSARVLVNRVWHYHFGTGIVDTPSDFGFLGGRPTHPELLDWLARRLHHHGWKLKPLHREIMLSQTYLQSCQYRQEMAATDAAARFLWRFPPRRLSAEEIRDTMLQISGKLDTKMGGPGYRLYRYLSDNVATYVPLDEHGPETYRRAVYHQNVRASRIDLLSDFDCADNACSAPVRVSTTTPLQALTLLNHGFTRDMAKFMAAGVEQEVGKDDPLKQVRRVFALAYARRPSSADEEAALKLVHRHGLAALCRALLNSNELIYLE